MMGLNLRDAGPRHRSRFRESSCYPADGFVGRLLGSSPPSWTVIRVASRLGIKF